MGDRGFATVVKLPAQRLRMVAQVVLDETLDEPVAVVVGGPAAQFKAFADATGERWFGKKWQDKLASGFTVSNSPSGDKFSTLQYFHTLAMQHGMIWIGLGELPMQPNGTNRVGAFGGVMAQGLMMETAEVSPNAEDKFTGELLGKRVATFAAKLTK